MLSRNQKLNVFLKILLQVFSNTFCVLQVFISFEDAYSPFYLISTYVGGFDNSFESLLLKLIG